MSPGGLGKDGEPVLLTGWSMMMMGLPLAPGNLNPDGVGTEGKPDLLTGWLMGGNLNQGGVGKDGKACLLTVWLVGIRAKGDKPVGSGLGSVVGDSLLGKRTGPGMNGAGKENATGFSVGFATELRLAIQEV